MACFDDEGEARAGHEHGIEFIEAAEDPAKALEAAKTGFAASSLWPLQLKSPTSGASLTVFAVLIALRPRLDRMIR